MRDTQLRRVYRVGPTDLTRGTLTNLIGGLEIVPTVTDNLFSQGTIAQDTLGIFFSPTTRLGASDGEVGAEHSRYTPADIATL